MAERARDIAPLADAWVLIELLSHLVNDKDGDYWPCRRAIRRLHRRCVDPGREYIQVVVDPQAQIARLLFGAPFAENVLTTEELVRVSRVVAEAPDEDGLDGCTDVFAALAEYVSNAEANFANTIRSLRAQIHAAYDDTMEWRAEVRTHLRSEDMLRLDATILTKRAYRQAGRTVPDPVPEEEVARVMALCGGGSRAAALALERVVCDDASLDKSRTLNLLWDQEIAMYIGKNVRGRDIIFVTEDGYFVEAAAAEGNEAQVWSCARYVEYLNVAA